MAYMCPKIHGRPNYNSRICLKKNSLGAKVCIPMLCLFIYPKEVKKKKESLLVFTKATRKKWEMTNKLVHTN